MPRPTLLGSSHTFPLQLKLASQLSMSLHLKLSISTLAALCALRRRFIVVLDSTAPVVAQTAEQAPQRRSPPNRRRRSPPSRRSPPPSRPSPREGRLSPRGQHPPVRDARPTHGSRDGRAPPRDGRDGRDRRLSPRDDRDRALAQRERRPPPKKEPIPDRAPITRDNRDNRRSPRDERTSPRDNRASPRDNAAASEPKAEKTEQARGVTSTGSTDTTRAGEARPQHEVRPCNFDDTFRTCLNMFELSEGQATARGNQVNVTSC